MTRPAHVKPRNDAMAELKALRARFRREATLSSKKVPGATNNYYAERCHAEAYTYRHAAALVDKALDRLRTRAAGEEGDG